MDARDVVGLDTPIAIRSKRLKNRLVLLPMGTRYANAGVLLDADLEWHRRRAAGGVALSIMGGTIVHESSRLRGSDLGAVEAFNERGQEAQRRRAAAIHAEGALVFGQLLHLGRETSGGQTEHPQWAPSAVRSPRVPASPHEMTALEIQTVIDGFSRSARMQEEAGLDGVEIHAAHGYLVAQFLSPQSNRRSDVYGGATPAARMRFLEEILGAVRAETSSEFVVGVRLSVDEEDASGIQPEESVEFAQRIDDAGLVDYLSLTVGMRGSYVKDNTMPHGVALDRIAKVHAATTLPTIAAGRITTALLAQRVVGDGIADMVGLGRAMIADPDWPKKALGRSLASIRPCVGFVQDCRTSAGGAICAVNATAGRESQWSPSPAPREAGVVVVGGGPGGLEAARLAAEAGMKVHLFEQESVLGGQWRLAAAAPHRTEFLGLIDYLESECLRLGVVIHLGARADAALLEHLAPDLVVLAAGSVPETSEFATASRPKVLTVADALGMGGEKFQAKRIVVVDDGSGFWHSVNAAEHASQAASEVTIVTPAATVGHTIPHESIEGVHRRLKNAGVKYVTFGVLDGAQNGQVAIRDRFTSDVTSLDADVLIVHAGQRARTGIAGEFEGPWALRPIGDCVAPRRLTDAVFEANTAIREFVDS